MGGIRLFVVLVIGAALRALWLYRFPPFDTLDTEIYVASGESLFAVGRMSSPMYMPLYPIILHVVGYDGVIYFQIALSTATIALVYALALELWADARAALTAAALCALYPALIYYANFRLTETVFIFLLVLGLLLIYRQQFFAASVALVLANLSKPSLDMVLALIIIAGTFAAAKKPSARYVLGKLAIFAAVYVTLMTPWWLHNYAAYGQFVRLTVSDGTTAILENNEPFERYGDDWSKSAPWTPFAQITDPVAQSEAMKAAALRYILTRPGHWLLSSMDRLRRFATPWPEYSRSSHPVLEKLASATIFVPAVLLGLIGSFWFAPTRRLLPLLIPIVFLTALHVATHAHVRYRLPLDPLLIVLCAEPLVFLVCKFARQVDTAFIRSP